MKLGSAATALLQHGHAARLNAATLATNDMPVSAIRSAASIGGLQVKIPVLAARHVARSHTQFDTPHRSRDTTYMLVTRQPLHCGFSKLLLHFTHGGRHCRTGYAATYTVRQLGSQQLVKVGDESKMFDIIAFVGVGVATDPPHNCNGCALRAFDK